MNTPRPKSIPLILTIIGLVIAYALFFSGKTTGMDRELSTDSPVQPAFVDTADIFSKQKGMHFFGRRGLDDQHLEELKRNHIEWLTVVPYGWQADYDSDQVGRRGIDYKAWTPRDSSFARQISWIKQNGFRVMMKPHIWMGDNASGKWRSDIDPQGGATGWQKWAESYRAFIMHYALMSEQLGVEMFCIGTELHRPAKTHPEFWKSLIADVREVFTGKITYAANWYKEIDDVAFWEDLDFIGVQAYYPLCKQTNPPLKDLLKGWKPYLNQLEKLHKRYGKPILFTEIGYKSTPDAAIEPWEWVDRIQPQHRVISLETQANCYEAFFRTFWHQKWFAGAHFWQWRSGHRQRDRMRDDFDFTPQNKPAEQTLSKWFSK